MEILTSLLVGGVFFGRSSLGIMTKPYETYRRIVDRANLGELFWLAALLACYFALASLVRTAAFRPFLLTKQFILLAGGATAGFALSVLVFWTIGRLVGGRGSIAALALAWAYTLVPTTVWFLATSLLYVLLPPPRTTSVLGITFSIVFLIFSITLFWWKLTLAYLTLRFGLKLDLAKILVVAAFSLPILAAYSVGMYRMGIFKVPFL